MNLSRYRKFITAIGAAVGVLITAVATDDIVTNSEWISIALAFAGALGVYQVPNDRSSYTAE